MLPRKRVRFFDTERSVTFFGAFRKVPEPIPIRPAPFPRCFEWRMRVRIPPRRGEYPLQGKFPSSRDSTTSEPRRLSCRSKTAILTRWFGWNLKGTKYQFLSILFCIISFSNSCTQTQTKILKRAHPNPDPQQYSLLHSTTREYSRRFEALPDSASLEGCIQGWVLVPGSRNGGNSCAKKPAKDGRDEVEKRGSRRECKLRVESENDR